MARYRRKRRGYRRYFRPFRRYYTRYRAYRRRRRSYSGRKKNNTLLYLLVIGLLAAGGWFVYNKFIKK